MRSRKFDNSKPLRPRASAFSLVELLAVILIISIMIAMLAPSIDSFSSVAGRKGAVNILMNTLEQARAAALETGCDVYVLLWQREYPDADALMVVRSPSEWILDASGNPESKLVPLTRWIQLPAGVLLHKPAKGDNVFSATGFPSDLEAHKNEIPMPSGESLSSQNIGVVAYTGNGSIIRPTGTRARIVVTEGVRGTGGTEALLRKKESQGSGGGFEIIRLSRFTGRSWLEVSTLD